MANNNEDGSPQKTVEKYFARAYKLREARDFDGAIANYAKILLLEPNNVIALNDQGYARNEKGEFDEALIVLNKAIQLNPNLALAWINRGNAWLGKSEYDEAIANYNEAIRLDPNSAMAWVNRGLVRTRRKEFNEAIKDCNEAIRLDPNYAPAWNSLGHIQVEAGEFDNALTSLNEAIRLKPDYIESWYNLGNAWFGKGEYDEAISNYNEALRLDQNFQPAIHNRAYAMALQSTGVDREKIAENLKKEYGEQLERDLQAARGQVIADTKDFQREENKNMALSGWLRLCSIIVLIGIAVGLFKGFQAIYFIELKSGGLKWNSFLTWVPVIAAMSSPFFLIWWMLQRWSYETKTLAYGFQRKRIVEERIFRFAGDDEKLRKELLKIYIVHWMEKSPLEVMLAIGGKGKSMGGGNSPTAALLESAENIIDKTGKVKVGD